MVVQRCRLVPKGRLNVIMWVCELFQIDKNILKQVCMENLDFGVREHSPSAATTSQIASAQEVCDPFETATGSPHSVLFWCLDPVASRPQSNARMGFFFKLPSASVPGGPRAALQPSTPRTS